MEKENPTAENNNIQEDKRNNKSYYIEFSKFIRDLVHGYVYLTKFDIDLIDTPEFQRLKDIRQLTCQHVYPSARHTRFEHSLGVMELMRQAIRNLNRNGFLSGESAPGVVIFNEQLQFNAALAALLHDVGHCPFSHLGELEFDSNLVWSSLCKEAEGCEELKGSPLLKKLREYDQADIKKPAATHEQMSCIMILINYYDALAAVKDRHISVDSGAKDTLSVDFELIIRSILGIEYPITTQTELDQNKAKNTIVRLLNSRAFDMDKLDYIMRDSTFTGIGAPAIDTHRLFRNIYLNNAHEYKLVFTNRAVPALQNMIEARDESYMYVYNHHTVVFSDFMYSYIFRRLAHNGRDYLDLVRALVSIENEKCAASGQNPVINDEDLNNTLSRCDPIVDLGIVSKDYLFSPKRIVDEGRSDSDLISLLNVLYRSLSHKNVPPDMNPNETVDDDLKRGLLGSIEGQFSEFGLRLDYEGTKDLPIIQDGLNNLIQNIKRVYSLIYRYKKREYLKPWWKTNSEFSNFMNAHILDDRVREKLCSWVCQGSSKDVSGAEFRSQLAKNVTYIIQKLWDEVDHSKLALLCRLESDEFFVIQRSARFLDTATIGALDIALRSNEILGSPGDVKYSEGNYYIKSLNNVIPQRDYYSMYAKNSFYVFLKRLPDDLGTPKLRNKHYQFVEDVFIFVATTLVNDGELTFKKNYGASGKGAESAEAEAHKTMYERFKKAYL